jgi:hypothetical protein
MPNRDNCEEMVSRPFSARGGRAPGPGAGLTHWGRWVLVTYSSYANTQRPGGWMDKALIALALVALVVLARLLYLA